VTTNNDIVLQNSTFSILR